MYGGLRKKQPFLFIVFGTSKHNIEVGGYGGNVCIYGVSCGWLFFLKNPGRVFFVSSLFLSASCPFCPRGHGLTLCISRCIKTYCTHRIDSEVIADLRFSASKISRLPPIIIVLCVCVCMLKKTGNKKTLPDHACPTSPVQGCDLCGPAHATRMQHTCNTHATHMQHDMQHEHFPCKFTVNMQDLTFPAQPQS